MKLVKFPSAFREAVGLEERKAIELNGRKYVIGEKALENPFAEYLGTVEDLVEYYPLFIRYLEKEYNTRVGGISVPLELYVQYQAGEENGVFGRLRKLVENSGLSLKLYPQGLIVFRYLKDTGKISSDRALVLDGGFKTLNASITDGKKVFFVKSFYDELGIRALMNVFREEVKRVYPEVPSNYVVLNRYFVEGKIPAGFRTLNVEKEKKKALKIYVEHLLKRLKAELSKVNTDFDTIVITGGLSHYVKPAWFRTNRKVHVTEEKEFANAIAMHYYRKATVLDLGFGDAKAVIDETA